MLRVIQVPADTGINMHTPVTDDSLGFGTIHNSSAMALLAAAPRGKAAMRSAESCISSFLHIALASGHKARGQRPPHKACSTVNTGMGVYAAKALLRMGLGRLGFFARSIQRSVGLAH